MIRSPIFRALISRVFLSRAFLAMSALSAAVALSGCNTDGALPMSTRAATPLSEKMVSEIASKNMDRDAPILVRTFKEEAELEVWKQDRTGRYALLKTYPICRWSGELGPKIREGDRQAPEGFYNITPGQMNPNSQYYLSFDLGFPNAFDRAHGRTGANLMVHGDCSSRGCYSMTDEQISEIYALGRDAFFGGQKSFQVQAYPFRMTPQNFAKHRTNPNMAFWRMLKKGNDHFEVTRLEPKVNVCEKHYVFDAEPPAGSTRPLSFHPGGRCPAFQVPQEVALAVQDKERQDSIQTAELIRRGTPVAPIRTNVDGGMHPVFVEAVKRHEIGVKPNSFLLASVPGTIPVTVRPPRIPELAGTPIMAASAPASRPTSGSQTQMAIAEPETPAPKPAARSGGLFGSLFSSDSARSTNNKPTSPIDRMAHLIGLDGSDESKVKQAAAVPEPKPKPAMHRTHVASHGAIRRAATEPARTRTAATPPPAPRPAPSPWPAVPAVAPPTTTAQAPAPAPKPAPMQAPADTAMNGAAPVVPAGTFANRWSTFR